MRNDSRGFTIVELLVVIVVIGILVSVTVVLFNGVSDRSKAAVLTSDLVNASKALESFKISSSQNEKYPVANDCNTSPASNTVCLKTSGTTAFSYQVNNTTSPATYCITATNGATSYKVSSTATPTVGSCTVATVPLTDTFSTALSGASWPTIYGGASTVSGRLRLPTTNTYSGVTSVPNLDLNAYPISIQILTLPNTGNGTTMLQFILASGASNIAFQVNSTTVSMMLTGFSTTSVSYNATDHRWLRVRTYGTNLLYEASPDNTTWTTLRSIPTPSWVLTNPVRLTLGSGYYGTETSPGYSEIDNVNL